MSVFPFFSIESQYQEIALKIMHRRFLGNSVKFNVREGIDVVKKINRIVAVLIIVAVVIVFSPLTAVAAEADEYIVQNGVLTKYNGGGGAVVIPDNLGITTIGKDVFAYNGELTDPSVANIVVTYAKPKITSIEIPAGVKVIESGAFRESVNLTSVQFPDSLISIGDGAFSSCVSLKSVQLPSGVRSVGKNAFALDVNLERINLPSGLKTISDFVFSNCHKLAFITIPYGVTSIGDYAFAYCRGLENVSLPSSIQSIGYNAFDWCFSLKSIILPDGITSIDNNAFYGDYGLTIQAAEGSPLEQYAKNVGLKFQSIPVVVRAVPTAAAVAINGQRIKFQAYNIDGYNYFRLRDLAQALNGSEKQFDINWDNQTRTILLTKGALYKPVGFEFNANETGQTVDAGKVVASVQLDGSKIGLSGYNIDGYNYFKLREVAYNIGFGVTWVERTSEIRIMTSVNYTE